jgi:hypothetical protein
MVQNQGLKTKHTQVYHHAFAAEYSTWQVTQSEPSIGSDHQPVCCSNSCQDIRAWLRKKAIALQRCKLSRGLAWQSHAKQQLYFPTMFNQCQKRIEWNWM